MSSIRLSQNIINRVFTTGFCPLHKRPTKAYFFNLFSGYIVAGNMFNAFFSVNGSQVSDLYVDGMTTEQFLAATGLQSGPAQGRLCPLQADQPDYAAPFCQRLL
jgi:hypothetical protein